MWAAYELKNGDVHLIPIFDTHDHVMDAHQGCWCKPVLDEDGVHTHNAADGRETNKNYHTLH